MDKSNFTFSEGRGVYEATISSFEVNIPKACMSSERIAFAETVIEAYPQKLVALAEFCKESEIFKYCYLEEMIETIVKNFISRF